MGETLKLEPGLASKGGDAPACHVAYSCSGSWCHGLLLCSVATHTTLGSVPDLQCCAGLCRAHGIPHQHVAALDHLTPALQVLPLSETRAVCSAATPGCRQLWPLQEHASCHHMGTITAATAQQPAPCQQNHPPASSVAFAVRMHQAFGIRSPSMKGQWHQALQVSLPGISVLAQALGGPDSPSWPLDHMFPASACILKHSNTPFHCHRLCKLHRATMCRLHGPPTATQWLRWSPVGAAMWATTEPCSMPCAAPWTPQHPICAPQVPRGCLCDSACHLS